MQNKRDRCVVRGLSNLAEKMTPTGVPALNFAKLFGDAPPLQKSFYLISRGYRLDRPGRDPIGYVPSFWITAPDSASVLATRTSHTLRLLSWRVTVNHYLRTFLISQPSYRLG